MKPSLFLVRILGLLAMAAPAPAAAAVPKLLNHQGRMAVNGIPFEGTGQFKFSLVSGNGATTYWSNNGPGPLPANAVSLTVSKGLYAVLLGDTSLTNMAALPDSALTAGDVRLRVWFNDGVNGFQQISPDQRLAAVPYALVASQVDQVLLGDIKSAPAKPVTAWGDNRYGQGIPSPLLTEGNVSAIAAGGDTNLALLKNGTIVQWGRGTLPPNGLTGITHIAAGTSHRLVRHSNGTVTAWGDNTYDQATVPNGLTTAAAVAAGEKHSLALLADGTVLAWGNNTFNQTDVPPGLNGVVALAAGYDHSLALRSDGTVVAWGRTDNGQATLPNNLSGVTAIAAGAYHSLAVKNDGSVLAWGWNNGGQCNVPGTLTGAVRVAAGYGFSLALKSDGTVTAWGDNTDWQLNVPALTAPVTALAAGNAHALALGADLAPARLARLDQANVFTDRIGIGRLAATNPLEVEGQASKSTAGNWLANSDRRIKQEIRSLTGALEKLDQVRLVDFRYSDLYLKSHPGIPDTRYLNVIAQEFAEVFPDHVKSSGEKMPDGSDLLQVDTYPLTIYSAAGVQELHRANKALEEQLAVQKKQLAAQEERLRRLEAALPHQP